MLTLGRSADPEAGPGSNPRWGRRGEGLPHLCPLCVSQARNNVMVDVVEVLGRVPAPLLPRSHHGGGPRVWSRVCGQGPWGHRGRDKGPARGAVAAPLPRLCPLCVANTRSSVVGAVEAPGRGPAPPLPQPHPWDGPRTLPGAGGPWGHRSRGKGPARGAVTVPLPHPCPLHVASTKNSVVGVAATSWRGPALPRPQPHPWAGPRTLLGA